MKDEQFATYRAFWPHYVGEHQNKTCRNLHFAGTALGLFLFVLSIANLNIWLLVAAPMSGYVIAFIGHYFFEKNQPATFRHPLWSFIADLQMFALMCIGRMDREVRRMGILNIDI